MSYYIPLTQMHVRRSSSYPSLPSDYGATGARAKSAARQAALFILSALLNGSQTALVAGRGRHRARGRP